jgi:hypothetical protein
MNLFHCILRVNCIKVKIKLKKLNHFVTVIDTLFKSLVNEKLIDKFFEYFITLFFWKSIHNSSEVNLTKINLVFDFCYFLEE